jgi:hypothetical protein
MVVVEMEMVMVMEMVARDWILAASGRGCCGASLFLRVLLRRIYGGLHGSSLI